MFRLFVARPAIVAAVVLSAGLLTGCADKASPAGSATPTGGALPSGGGADTTVAQLPPGSANLPASPSPGSSGPAGAAAPAPDAVLPSGGLPNRSHRDSVALASMTKPDSVLDAKWPVKMAAPLPGAIFPANRVVAFYGNPLVKKMGVLGEYPKDDMLSRLDREVARWAKADPSTPVIPALHVIVTVASGTPGKNGLYRTQMFDSLTNTVHSWAKEKKALTFLDVQVGKSSVAAEVPRLRAFLENPDVHLGIDPEFAMATSGAVPGTKIGTLDAKDINWAINFLDEIVRAKHLPPKVLVVHRFTRKMVTNAKDIRPTPNVQVVMDMDGWGPPWLKFDSYHDYVKAEPVQFTGFKLFFHNDTKGGDPMLTPAEVLRLNPRPLYIQYQ
ncbi:lipoprotein [soil metagenome]